MFIQNRAKSIAQRLNAKNIAPLRAKIAEFADKIAESSAKFDDIISLNAKFKKSSAGNSVLGMQFRTCENFGESTDFSLVLSPKFSQIQKPHRNHFDCDSLCESIANQTKIAESTLDSAESQNLGGNQKPIKGFCYFWLSPKVESPLPLNPNLPNNVDSANLLAMAENKGFAESTPSLELEALLKDLKPWRKGPFNICGIEVQSEWDSAIKFNIIAPHLSVEGKVVADIGCNNGYYSFRLLPLRPSKIVCFEPSAHCKMQFDLINAFARSEICFEMLGVEDLAEYDCKFDCILCLGVIYHRTNPLDCLRILKNALRARGELIIDTLIIEGEGEIALSPLSYAKMKNVYFIPSISAFKNWLVRAGFREIELLCVKKTTSEEQRKTAWSGGESLEDFLDKEDKNKTIEGYSAPTRAYFKAKI